MMECSRKAQVTTRSLPLAVLLLANTSCGTIHSRGGYQPFGRYPFQAVVFDLVHVPGVFGDGVDVLGTHLSGTTVTLWSLLSLPIDLVADAVLLPVDVIAWTTGASKDTLDPLGQRTGLSSRL